MRTLLGRTGRRRFFSRTDDQNLVEGAGAKLETAPARGFEPAGAVLPSEPQNAQTGSEPLLRMRSAFENDRRQFDRVGANGGGVTPDAINRPAGIAPMGARHVFRQRGVATTDGAAHMAGDALAFVEQLYRALGGTNRRSRPLISRFPSSVSWRRRSFRFGDALKTGPLATAPLRPAPGRHCGFGGGGRWLMVL
jgi:hypothetical protein